MSMRRKVVIAVTGVLAAITLGVVLRLSVADDGPVWHPWDGPTIVRDLDAIKDDTLRVLVLRDPLVWEERSRATTGLEFDLLQRFVRNAKLKMKVIPFDDPDSLLLALWNGTGDIGALQAVAHDEWKDRFATSEPYATVLPVLARQRPGSDKEEIPVIDTVHVASGSPFAQAKHDHALMDEDHVVIAHATEDELLMQLVLGKAQAAIVSDLRAGHEAQRFPVIEFSDPVGAAVDLRFAVRATSPKLLAALNARLLDKAEVEARRSILRAYVDEIPPAGYLRSLRAKGMRGDSVSPFDDEFRKHAATTGWDWQLLAAMAWKETRFDSTVTSHQGAMGIMQFMPTTAVGMGLDSASHMGDHINAAGRYLRRLDMIWLRAVPDKQQRLRFVLASYNSGPGHIIDAQRLADQLGLDPTKWEGNVERAVLLLAKPRYFQRPELKNGYCKGSQVYHYVRGVLTVYQQLKARGH